MINASFMFLVNQPFELENSLLFTFDSYVTVMIAVRKYVLFRSTNLCLCFNVVENHRNMEEAVQSFEAI